MVTKNHRTILVVFSTLFTKNDQVKIIIFNIPEDWCVSLLQMFIDARLKELNLRLDFRPISFIDITSDNIKTNELQTYLKTFKMLKKWIHSYVKIETSDKFEVYASPYNIPEIRIRNRPTSIIHVTKDKVFNSDTRDIDETVSRYILTSNTVSSFMVLGDSSSLLSYKDLLYVNDISLVFHDVTIGEIVELSHQLFEMANELSIGLLDIFSVDNYDNIYQLSFNDNGIAFNVCKNTKDGNYYEYGK